MPRHLRESPTTTTTKPASYSDPGLPDGAPPLLLAPLWGSAFVWSGRYGEGHGLGGPRAGLGYISVPL